MDINQQQLEQLIATVIKEVVAEQQGNQPQQSGTTSSTASVSQSSPVATAEKTTSGSGVDAQAKPAATNAPEKSGAILEEVGEAQVGTDPKEVVVGISPAFATHIFESIIGIRLGDVLKQVAAGIEEEGLHYRFVKIYRTADVSFIAHDAAKLSGSGIGIGIQSRGTTVIHQKDLFPLSNLELFPQAPLIDLDTFRAIGKNAAQYAKGEFPNPVPVRSDQMARPKYQAVAALLHNKETKLTNPRRKSQALKVSYV